MKKTQQNNKNFTSLASWFFIYLILFYFPFAIDSSSSDSPRHIVPVSNTAGTQKTTPFS